MATVLILVSAALADTQVPEGARRYLEQIETEVNWVSMIINDMVTGPVAAHNAKAVDITRLVRDAVNSEQLTCAQRIILRQPGHDHDM